MSSPPGPTELTVLGRPEAEVHAVSHAAWGTARFVTYDELPRTRVAGSVVALDPHRARPGTLGALRRPVSAVVLERPGIGDLFRLAHLLERGWVSQLSWPAPPPFPFSAKVIATIPCLVDVERLDTDAAFRARVDQLVLHSSAVTAGRLSTGDRLAAEALTRHDAVLVRTRSRRAVIDAVLAMALGKCVIADRALPPFLGLERDEEYLVSEGDLALALARLDASVTLGRSLRTRAHQHVRTSFASPVLLRAFV